MRQIVLLISFMSLIYSNMLDRNFYMEYIIKIQNTNKGVLRIKNDKGEAKVEYVNIDKNDNLPFFYKEKIFKYKKTNKLQSHYIKSDKKYQIKYKVNKDEADEYNIASIDRDSTAAIKDLDADEVIATFNKHPLNTFEGLILYFMNNAVNKKDRIWLYEPQKNILFNLGVLKSNNQTIKINKRDFNTKKLIIGRISFDNTKRIPLFELYLYKNKVLQIRSISGKYTITLNGIGSYKKGVFSATKSIFDRTMIQLKNEHQISINVSGQKKKYNNKKFIISADLEVPKSTLIKREKDNLFDYISFADSSDLKGKKGLKFKSVSQEEICSDIKNKNKNKYTRDCKYRNNPQSSMNFDINEINTALKRGSYQYQECEIKDDINVIAKYTKQLRCTNKYNNKEEIKHIPDIAKIIIKDYNANSSNSNAYFTYQDSDRVVQNDKFYLKIDVIEHIKVKHYDKLIKTNASDSLKAKFFNKKHQVRNLSFYKEGEQYGFSINEEKFHLYICNKESSLEKSFLYNRGGCYIKQYTQNFNEYKEARYISQKLNEEKVILKLTKRKTRKENGKIYFQELQGKSFNNFEF